MGCCCCCDYKRPEPSETLNLEEPDALCADDTQLAKAAGSFSLIDVKTLLAAGADPNRAGPNGVRPIFAALRMGDEVIIKELLNAKVDVNLKSSLHDWGVHDCSVFEAMCYGLQDGQHGLMLLEWLVDAGATLEPEKDCCIGLLSVHFRPKDEEGLIRLAAKLIELGANPKLERDAMHGRTAIENLALTDCPKAMQFYGKHGCRLVPHGLNPSKAVKSILQLNPSLKYETLALLVKIAMEEGGEGCRNPLDGRAFAELCCHKDPSVVRRVIREFNIDVASLTTVTSEIGNTPFASACEFDGLGMIELLLSYANVEQWLAPTRTCGMPSHPLVVAARRLQAKTIKWLTATPERLAFSNGSVINHALLTASECSWSQKKKSAAIEALLEAGADPEMHNDKGASVLVVLLAAAEPKIYELESLLTAVDITSEDLPEVEDNEEKDAVRCIQLLLGGDKKPGSRRHRSGAGGADRALTLGTPLMIAVRRRAHRLVEVLLKKHGADPNSSTAGCLPLEWASSRGEVAMVKTLVQHGATPSTAIVKLAPPGETQLEISRIFKVSLSESLPADVIIAAKTAEQLRKVLESDPSAINSTASDGSTPLAVALAAKNQKRALLLVEHGASLETRDLKGIPALHLALQFCTSAEQLKELIAAAEEASEGAAINVNIATVSSGNNAAHYVLGLDITEEDSKKKAKPLDREFCAKLSVLMEYGMDVNGVNVDGETCLFSALRANNLEAVRHLLDDGEVDTGITSADGSTVLHVACDPRKKIQRDITKLLIEKSTEDTINGRNFNGKAPLHLLLAWTTNRVIVDVLRELVEHGADVNLKTLGNDTSTPLGLLCDSHVGDEHYEQAFGVLLEAGAIVTSSNLFTFRWMAPQITSPERCVRIVGLLMTHMDPNGEPIKSIGAVCNLFYRAEPRAAPLLMEVLRGAVEPELVAAAKREAEGEEGEGEDSAPRIPPAFTDRIVGAILSTRAPGYYFEAIDREWPGIIPKTTMAEHAIRRLGAGGVLDPVLHALVEKATFSADQLATLIGVSAITTPELVTLLLRRGASADGFDDSRRKVHTENPPLTQACQHSSNPHRYAIIKVLLEAGANPNRASSYTYRTPLHMIVEMPESRELTKLLMSHGADPYFTGDSDAPEKTAVGSAMQNEAEDRIQLLVDCCPTKSDKNKELKKRLQSDLERLQKQQGDPVHAFEKAYQPGALSQAAKGLTLAKKIPPKAYKEHTEELLACARRVISRGDPHMGVIQVLFAKNCLPIPALVSSGGEASAEFDRENETNLLALAIHHCASDMGSFFLKKGACLDASNASHQQLLFESECLDHPEFLLAVADASKIDLGKITHRIYGSSVALAVLNRSLGSTSTHVQLQLLLELTARCDIALRMTKGSLSARVTVAHCLVPYGSDELVFATLQRLSTLERSAPKTGLVAADILVPPHRMVPNQIKLSAQSVEALIDAGADVNTLIPGDAGDPRHPLHCAYSHQVQMRIIKRMTWVGLHDALETMPIPKRRLNSSAESEYSRLRHLRERATKELRWLQWREILLLAHRGPPALRRLFSVRDLLPEVFDFIFPARPLPWPPTMPKEGEDADGSSKKLRSVEFS